MLLTIGMACYDDYDGVVFTVQSLLMHHDLSDCEVIVVDSNPDSPDGESVADYCNKHQPQNVRYIPSKRRGTTQPRQQVFDEAEGRFVMVVDCHILLASQAIKRVKHWCESNPTSRDIYSGPLMLDDGGFHTHFNEQWRAQMYGTWGMAWQCRCGQPLAVIQEREAGAFVTLSSPQKRLDRCPRCGTEFWEMPWNGHQVNLLNSGFQPLGFSDSDPTFEVPGMGLGLFLCRREAWPGFNPHFSGFGGEELYIHEKVRQNGGKAVCLPFLKWWHRFGRPGGIPYRAATMDRVRNYVLGFQELGLPLDPIYNHFVSDKPNPFDSDAPSNVLDILKEHLQYEHAMDLKLLTGGITNLHRLHGSQKVSSAEWEKLLTDPVNYTQPTPLAPKPTVMNMSLNDLFEHYRNIPRDLDQHLPKLKELAEKCDHVTEISKRRESTLGLMAGCPITLISYNSEYDPLHEQLKQIVMSNQRIKDGLSTHRATHVFGLTPDFNSVAITIDETDLLYIDEIHAGERLKKQLELHAPKVRRYLVIRGTGHCGERSEDQQGPGLFHGIRWLLAEDPNWFVCYHTTAEYGLTVLSKHPDDKPAQEIRPWPKGYGPGTELKEILAQLGIDPAPSCDCNARAWQMDEWGVEGCKANREMIIDWLQEGAPRWGWSSKIPAALKAITSGLFLKMNPLDPFPGLVDLAIERAYQNQPRCSKEASNA